MKKRAKRTAKRHKLARDMTMRELVAMELMAAITSKFPPKIVGEDGWTRELDSQRRESIAIGAMLSADTLIRTLRAREVKQ